MRRTVSIALVTLAVAAVGACTAKTGPQAGGDASFDVDSGPEFDAGGDATTSDAADDASVDAMQERLDDATPEASPNTPDSATQDAPVDSATGTGAETGVEAGPEASTVPEAGGPAEAGPDAARPMCVNPATDCPATGTLCKVAVCTGGVCAVQIAAKGAACNDVGGNLCDQYGDCVDGCLDGLQDAMETDVDCGGAYCDAQRRTCADGKKCMVGADCLDKVCIGNVCAMPTCSDGQQNGTETGVDCGGSCSSSPTNQACPSGDTCYTATDCLSGECNSSDTCVQRTNGEQCWNGAQSCASGHCANVSNGLGSICCDTDCTGTCQYCGGGTGLTYGMCGQVPAGPAPSGQCARNGTCGNDGNCTATGTCEQEPTTYNCGPTCVGTTLTANGFCSGDGGCGGVVSDCTPYACSTFVPACNTTCSSSAQCAPGHTCTAGACM